MTCIKATFAAAALLVFLAGGVQAQSPLDAPGEKKVTVGTEISRGFSEMIGQFRAKLSLRIAESALAMEAVIDRNEGKNSDSPGFMLGARIAEWFALDTSLRTNAVLTSNSEAEIAEASKLVRTMHADIRKRQHRLNLSNDEMLRALGKSPEQLEEFRILFAAYDAP